ncbi:dTMP kinase [Bosea sp. NPDC003192]|uniref:dTMP kinase n=1 Tax=Bosea sp. NPDC003192 TaxID=3390551 RepID=UPI003CFE31BA
MVAFEGPNEVGKTTVSRELAHQLSASGRSCEWHAFPGRSPGTLGQHIYDLHHRPASFGLGEVAPSAIQALHIAAHLDAIERTILPKLAAGVDIVLDRYWWSTIAYGVATGVPSRLLDSLVASELIAWNGLQPTLVVVLDRSFAKPRSQERSCADVLQREYRRLLEAAGGRHAACFVDNNGTVEQTVAGVADLLGRLNTPVGDVE